MAKHYIAGQLSNRDFKHIRQGLLMTQLELARVLGYRQKIRISEFERETNPVPIPIAIQQALLDLRATGGTFTPGRTAVRKWVRNDAA